MTGDLEAVLAAHVAAVRFDRLPGRAIEVAKAAIRDTVGVALAGAREPAATIVAEMVRADGGRPDSTVLAQGFRAPPAGAALANGVAAHALDFDDSHHPGMVHPSAVLLPAVLAAAQARGSSGRDVLTAYLCGLDVLAALASAMNPGHYAAGWHATGTVGAIGAAAAVARLHDLDPAGVRAALALAATRSHGLRSAFGAMAKPLHAGSAARAGLESADLARRGFTGGASALGGRYGILAVQSGGPPDEVADRLGMDRAVGGLSLKRYPSCGVTQAPIEAALRLGPVVAADVVEVECVVEPFIRTILLPGPPDTGAAARFNLEHCVAVALLDGEVGLAQFADERARAGDVRALAARVRVRDRPGDAAPDLRWPCEVSVRLRDGRRLVADVAAPAGRGFGELLPEAALVAKFRDCAGWGGLSAGAVEECLDLLGRLEEAPDLGALAALTQGAPRRHDVEATPTI